MKQWTVAKFDKTASGELAQKCGIPPFLAMLLSIRGFDTEEKIKEFLSDEPLIADPYMIKDMDKAVERITKAIRNLEKICVYGDYDADGVTSTTLLYSYLETIDANVMYYIPSREEEGYGLNNKAIDYIKEQKVSLIITVDNGIAAIDEVEYAASLGIDVVITDHHTPLDQIPNACAVVDMHQKDCKSRFKMLSGVGVAFKLVMALEGEYADIIYLLENYADLVCIGTIGDIVPLVDENRILVKYGLGILKNSERIGVRALLKECSLLDKDIDSTSVSFGIVPRINAAGRLGFSNDCVTLFLTEEEDKAEEIAQKLANDNNKRKEIENEILAKINLEILRNPSIIMDKIIVIDGDNWHQGVIGIVASRIKDIYSKPVIIITKDGETAKGSGRSIEGFSLCDAVFSCKDVLTHFGGHPMAVGLSLNTSDIPKLKKRLNEYTLNVTMPYDTLKIDCKLNPAMLDTSLVHTLKYLEPYGSENTKPIFGLYNMLIKEITPIKSNKYIRIALTRGNSTVQVICFTMTPYEFPYKQGDLVDLAVTLDINEYKGIENLSIVLKDIKPSGFENREYIDSRRIFEEFCKGEIKSKDDLMTIYPQREDFAAVYRLIRSRNGFNYKIENLCNRLDHKISYGKVKVILEAMSELKLIEIYEGLKTTEIKYIPTTNKVDLQSSQIIRSLREAL